MVSKRRFKKLPSQALAGRRLWLFRVIVLTVIPILLFLTVELSLRVAGYGFSPHAIIKCQVDGRDAYCDNVKFGWRFFPRNIARESEPFVFSAEKSENTFRIFILGASAAQGTPEPAYGFGRILQKILEEEYPKVNFKIINTAMTAINSHVVLEIAKSCIRHDPDLFILYLGNNEVAGPYGAGTVYTLPAASLPVIRIGIALKATRLGQLLTSLADSIGGIQKAPTEWLGMTMFLNKQVRSDASQLEAVYYNFQRNLRDIRQIALKNRRKMIFCTVGSNLKDSPPFASLHRPDLSREDKKKWDDIYRQGVEFESNGDYADAIESYLEATKIDNHYADLQFRLGRCYWANAEYEKSSQRYVRARDLDTLRFRADTKINNIIRKVATDRAAEGIYLIDSTEVFGKNSPHSTPGRELFYEHVHLNFKGNYYLAKAIAEQVHQILPPHFIKTRRAGERQILTEDGCAERLAYTGWDRYKIADKVLNGFIKIPPFTNQLYQHQRLTRMEKNVDDLKVYLAPEALENAAQQYREAIKKSPSDWRLHWNYGKLLTDGLKDYKAAAEQGRLLQKYLPHSYLVYTSLGAISRGLGDLDEAVTHYLKAIRLKPTCIEAHYYLALIYQRQDKIDGSIEYYSKTLQLQPTHVQAYNNLVDLLFSRGSIDEGIKICRKALVFAPDSAILHCNLGIMLDKQGNKAEAIKELNTAIKLDPNSPKLRGVLDGILKRGE
jgi:tetratricopeptide (TPR) repeat protein